jgi:hypothetical protein
MQSAGEILFPEVLPASASRKALLSAAQLAFENEDEHLCFQHTVFCQASLPYRDPGPNERTWTRQNGKTSLHITAKDVWHPIEQQWRPLGIPYGPKARLFLADIHTQAIRRQTPVIDLERSLRNYLKRLNLPTSGRNFRLLKEALWRICAAQVQIGLPNKQLDTQLMCQPFGLWANKEERQAALWPSEGVLDPLYFHLLLEHSVPFRLDHYYQLAHSARAMDIYTWLAQRLCRIKTAQVHIPWQRLQEQFGPEYERMRDFRRAFKQTLAQVLTVYTTARIRLEEQGAILRLSPSPIAKTQILIP